MTHESSCPADRHEAYDAHLRRFQRMQEERRKTEERLRRCCRVMASDGLEALTDDNFLFLTAQVDGHYIERFPTQEDIHDVEPF